MWPPCMGHNSYILLTSVTLHYQTCNLLKGKWVVIRLYLLYILSLESSGGGPCNLRVRWSSWQMEVNLREPQTIYKSAPCTKLVEANTFTQIGPFHTHPVPVDSAIVNNFIDQGWIIQYLTSSCTWTPAKWTQNQYNLWWTSENTRAASNQPHKQHTQRGISASTRSCWKQLCLGCSHLIVSPIWLSRFIIIVSHQKG